MSDERDYTAAELDAMYEEARKQTTAYKFFELHEAVKGCALIVADRLIVPALELVMPIVEWFTLYVIESRLVVFIMTLITIAVVIYDYAVQDDSSTMQYTLSMATLFVLLAYQTGRYYRARRRQ